MNPYALLGGVAALLIAFGAVFVAGQHAGSDKCTAGNATAVVAAATRELAQGAVTAKKDGSNAGNLAVGISDTTDTTTTLRGAIHDHEQQTPAPGAVSHIPNPFPVGFSVCWNAAATRDPAAVAACQAIRSHGALQVGSPADGGHGQAAGDAGSDHQAAAGAAVPGAAGPGPGAGHARD